MDQDFKLDRWQREVLAHKGSIAIRAGRQVGKSTVIGIKAAQFARDYPGTTTLVIAASHNQSKWLFEKIKGEIEEMIDKDEIGYEEDPTLTRVVLSNGSRIYALPAGRTGYFIRGLAIDLLIADEAAFMSEEVWRAVIPMIAVSKSKRGLGWIILLSTPYGKGGYFYECCMDGDFRHFHLSSEECPRIPDSFLAKEKKRMSKAEYAQEYLGEFIDEWNQFFPTKTIKKCMQFHIWDTDKEYDSRKSYYMGVDVARYGGSENAFIIAEMDWKKRVKVVKALVTKRVAITDTIGRIKDLDEKFKFRKVFIDDEGIGGGVMDVLLEDMGRKIIGISNSKRTVDKEGNRKRILKEDLYSNALVLMESNLMSMIADVNLLRSLKSIIFEYTRERRVSLHGDYSHLAEAFVRACWCIKDRGLRPTIV